MAVWVSSSSREVGALEPLCEGRLVLFKKKRERLSLSLTLSQWLVLTSDEIGRETGKEKGKRRREERVH